MVFHKIEKGYGFMHTLALFLPFFKIEPPQKELKLFFKDFLDKKPDEKLFKDQMQIKRLKELYEAWTLLLMSFMRRLI